MLDHERAAEVSRLADDVLRDPLLRLLRVRREQEDRAPGGLKGNAFRVAWAQRLENQLLDQGLNATVIATGKDHTGALNGEGSIGRGANSTVNKKYSHASLRLLL